MFTESLTWIKKEVVIRSKVGLAWTCAENLSNVRGERKCAVVFVKVVLVHAVKTWWNGRMTPLILNIGSRIGWMASLMFWAVYTWGKLPHHPLNWGKCEPHYQSGCFEEDIHPLPLSGIEPRFFRHEAHSTVTGSSTVMFLACVNHLGVSFIPHLSHVLALSVKPVIFVCILSQPFAGYSTLNLPLKCKKKRKRIVSFQLKNFACKEADCGSWPPYCRTTNKITSFAWRC